MGDSAQAHLVLSWPGSSAMGNYASVDDLKRRIGIHVPKLKMPPRPHPSWDELPADVRTLLKKVFQVAPKNPHLVFWENHLDPMQRWRSFVAVHLPDMGWDVARADRALAIAVEQRLAVRPNVHGRLLWWEGVGLIWGDWVYLTALADKLVRCAPAESGKPPVEGEGSPSTTDDAWLGHAEIARRFGVDAENLRQRLNRFRKTNHDCYREVAEGERKPTEPKYLYRLSLVRPIIVALKASTSTSASRPPNVQRR